MSDIRIDDIRQLLAEDDLETALPQILQLARGLARFEDEAVLLLARLRAWERRKRTGTETSEALRAERVVLTQSALSLLGEVERRRTRTRATSARIDLGQPEVQLEKLYGQAPLRDLAWLHRGLLLSRAICRVIAPGLKGTGFVIAGGWLITNHHVLPDAASAAAAECEFNYEEDLDGHILTTTRYRVDPTTYLGDAPLDFARVKLVDRSDAALAGWGQLQFERATPAKVGDHVAIIQHPDGGPKKIAMGGNQVVNLYDHRLHYMTDTMPGSSGAPVFNDRWHVVAVHHAGGNLTRSARGDRIYANEGIVAGALAALLPA